MVAILFHYTKIQTIILFFLHSMAISRQKSFHLLNQIPRTHFLHAVLQFLLQGQAPNQHRPSVCFLTYLHEKKAGKYFPCILPEFHSLYLQIDANIPRWTAYLHAQDPDMGWLKQNLLIFLLHRNGHTAA